MKSLRRKAVANKGSPDASFITLFGHSVISLRVEGILYAYFVAVTNAKCYVKL